MRKIIFILLTALPLLASAQQSASGAKKIQCWTDDKGSRNCGDHVPPQYAKEQRDIYNSQGVVIGTQARQKTPAEVAEDERKAAEAAAAQRHIEEQAAYDRFLMDTYGSSKELESTRDLRLQMIDGRVGLAQKAISDNQKTLDDLRSRVAAAKAAGKAPDDKLLKQVQKFEDSLADSTNAVSQLQKEREGTQTKFGQDIERYKQLRPGH